MTGVASTPRYRIAHIDNAGDHLVIHWQDRHRSRFDALWLRYACECASCGTYHSAIRSLRLVDIPEDIRIASTRTGEHGTLDVIWSGDGHASSYAGEWLRNRCNRDYALDKVNATSYISSMDRFSASFERSSTFSSTAFMTRFPNTFSIRS